MAPKKGKAPMKADKSAAASREAEAPAALPASRFTAEGIDKVRHLATA